jgi:hypothetical protein
MEYYTVYHGYLFFVIQPWKMATFEERRPSFGHLATLQKKSENGCIDFCSLVDTERMMSMCLH